MCPGKDMVTGSGGAVLGTRGRGQEEFNLTQAQACWKVLNESQCRLASIKYKKNCQGKPYFRYIIVT